ncbi:MAG: 50S ribosomal protein L24 [Patescibacteria group bacterium]
MKIKKNDTVKIIAGKDKNKTGKVLKVLSAKGKILIEGLNLYKKHVRPKRQGEKGQVVLVPRPIDASNVMLVCSGCGKAARVGFRLEGKNKIRYCKNCRAKI